MADLAGAGAVPRRFWSTRWFVLAVALLAALPLIWPDVPPLVDLPGHMARYRVQLSHGSNPDFIAWYDFRWSLIGNLGIDLLIEPLAPLIGLEPAVKLIVLATPVLTVSGLLWIAREVHGEVPPSAFFAVPLAYSYPFQFGFVNFALSMALALNAFALWLRLARLGHLRLRAAVFVPISVAIWICHTFGWGVLGVLAYSAELVRLWDKERKPVHAVIGAGISCLSLALPMVFMVVWRSGDHVGGQTADFFNWRLKWEWTTMILRDRWMWFDLGSLVLIGLILLGAIRHPHLTYSRNLTMSALFLCLVYLCLPRIVFGSAYADMRLAPFVLAVAVIALRPRVGLSRRNATLIAVTALTFAAVRIGAGTVSYWRYDRDYDTELAALNHLPPNSRLVTFVGAHCIWPWAMTRLEHIPGLALVRRGAFTNDQWSMAGAQLLTVHYAPGRGYNHDPSQLVTLRKCRREFWRPVNQALAEFPREAYDYVWLVRPPPYDRRLEAGLQPLWRSGTSTLFRVIDRRRPVLPAEPDPTQPPRRNGAISASAA